MANHLEPVYQVKLLAALRSGDPALIHPFLTEIGKDRRSSTCSTTGIDCAAAALHLAVRCGSSQTVALLLSHRAISPNGVHPPESGTTPLHLAASLARVDIVSLLLEQDGVDDGLRDANGKTCRDVAKGKDVVKAIDDSRSFLNASYRSLLRSYILSPTTDPPSSALLHLLESPRITFVNLSYLDDASGSSLLHEAAKRKDLRLIELAVRAGADVFVRNRKGKMAYESAGKDDKVRVFLRQFANHDRSLIQAPLPVSEPPTLKGYLNKYTNVARGYNTRWFVLAHGVLSYYRHQDDESVASRGSISMKNALIKINEQHRTRFEVQSLPNHHPPSSSSIQKWYIRANHPVEAARWIQAINKSIEWARRDVDSELPTRPSGESETRSMHSTGTGYSNTVVKRPPAQPPSLSRRSTTGAGLDAESINAALSVDPNSSDVGNGGGRDTEGDDGEEEDEQDGDDTSSADTGNRQHPPHDDAFELHGNSMLAQLEITQSLLATLFGATGSTTGSTLPPPQAISSSRSVTSTSTKSTSTSSKSTSNSHKSSVSTTNETAKSTLLESLTTLHTLISEYTSMSKDREQWFKKQLASERARQSVWEESLATVVREGANLEEELRMRSRRRGSRVFGPSEAFGSVVARGGVVGLGSPGSEIGTGRRRGSGRYSTIKPVRETVVEEALPEGLPVLDKPVVGSPPPAQISTPPVPPTQTQSQMTVKPTEKEIRKRTSTVDTIKADQITPTEVELADEYDSEDEDEDEFFDAIDSNNIPNLIVPPSLGISSTIPPISPAYLPPFVSIAPYKGYEVIRSRLTTADERPPTSLWSVLKHSIGKDLTRISFPVFFNEPTSMLQRMAEDMEFSECLDTAATQRDSLKRLAYVSAFAMSNYSSTIGRIAKPFNPMLSETFEYVRLDKKYRYVSEQVSHHPPISACWAESPLWHYFGEVDAQNKFMGKSFEIRPTGVAHAELIIPESWITTKQYRKAEGLMGEGKVVEHYTWKKVTTNVSGFILGSPTIDHYGDMIITNHRTNERCILTFKPRGWRGKDAYEISGQVLDSRGRVVYEIAGRWNSQLIMREVGKGYDGVLHPDTTVSSSSSSSSSLDNGLPVSPTSNPGSSPEYTLLWKNSNKPPGSPFNLTPFAISLNDCPRETLRPYLCPTDCRLRPDQRAFEIGKYDLANELKQKQEEKQRATRREREMGVRDGHRPRWFVAQTDGDTGERVWMPKRVRVKMRVDDGVDGIVNGDGKVVEEERLEYWVERERVWREGGNVGWKDVEDVFIEEPEVIRNV